MSHMTNSLLEKFLEIQESIAQWEPPEGNDGGWDEEAGKLCR